jgi:hypothetical protein
VAPDPVSNSVPMPAPVPVLVPVSVPGEQYSLNLFSVIIMFLVVAPDPVFS